MRRQDRTDAGDRGSDQPPTPRRLDWRTIGVFLGLLLLNYVIVSLVMGVAANPRVTIPYRPHVRRPNA